jgi:hypothetical protein
MRHFVKLLDYAALCDFQQVFRFLAALIFSLQLPDLADRLTRNQYRHISPYGGLMWYFARPEQLLARAMIVFEYSVGKLQPAV